MTCRSCGAELPADAKFCHQCGSAVAAPEDAPTEAVSPAAASEEVPTEVVTPEAAEADVQAEAAAEVVEAPAALPADDTQTGVESPVLQATVPTPPRAERARKPLEEQGAWEEFTRAVLPLLTAPRFTGNLLAAAVAFVVSFVAALITWAIFRGPGEGNESVLLPGFVDAGDDGGGVLALLTFVFHQVPFVSGDEMQHTAPLLLALVPLVGCALGVVVARRLMPCSGRRDGFFARAFPFALSYAALLFFWSLWGADGWHAAHGRAFLAGLVFAALGAWLAERWLARRGELAGTGAAAAAATDDAIEPPIAEPQASRLWVALRTGAVVFALMIVVGSLLWLVGTLVAQAQSDEFDLHASVVVSSILHLLEGGFEAVGFGVLAEGTPFGFIDDDAGWRVFELTEPLADVAAGIYLVVALAVVVIGGLFSGFAIARRVTPRSRNDHALFGAVTGIVWSVAMLLAQFLVLPRFGDGDETYTAFDGVETVCFSLVIGALLGGLGGLLVATSRERAAVRANGDEAAA